MHYLTIKHLLNVGRPASLEDENNPDWTPSLILPSSSGKKASKRKLLAKERQERYSKRAKLNIVSIIAPNISNTFCCFLFQK